jgi:hypothetical protein
MEDTVEIIVPDYEIEAAWENANFGNVKSKRQIIKENLLSYACNHRIGYTIMCILRELRLINKAQSDRNQSLSARGKRYLYCLYKDC